MSATFRAASGTSTAATGSTATSWPAGLVDGDLVILVITGAGGSKADATLTTPPTASGTTVWSQFNGFYSPLTTGGVYSSVGSVWVATYHTGNTAPSFTSATSATWAMVGYGNATGIASKAANQTTGTAVDFVSLNPLTNRHITPETTGTQTAVLIGSVNNTTSNLAWSGTGVNSRFVTSGAVGPAIGIADQTLASGSTTTGTLTAATGNANNGVWAIALLLAENISTIPEFETPLNAVPPVGVSATGLLGSQRQKMDRNQDGTLWTLVATASANFRARYSKDNGQTWTVITGQDFALTTQHSMFIDLDDYAHVVFVASATGTGPQATAVTANYLYYMRGTINAGRTAWTWTTPKVLNTVSGTASFPDVVAFRDASTSGWSAVVTADFNDGVSRYPVYARIPISSGNVIGTVAVDGLTTAAGMGQLANTQVTSSPIMTPTVDFHHNGDAKTVATSPHLYIGWTDSGGVHLRKATYSAGAWTFATAITSTSGSGPGDVYSGTSTETLQTYYTGTRAVIAGCIGTNPDLYALYFTTDDSAVSGSATTLSTFGWNTVGRPAVTYDPSGNIWWVISPTTPSANYNYIGRLTPGGTSISALLFSDDYAGTTNQAATAALTRRGTGGGGVIDLVTVQPRWDADSQGFFRRLDTRPAVPTVAANAATSAVVLSAVSNTLMSDNWYSFFQVATDAGFTSVVFSGSGSTVAAGATSTLTAYLAASTTYYVRAYATAGASGSSAYSAGSSFTTPAPLVQTFTATGGPQTYTVPANVTSMTVECYGAQGAASADGMAAGLGGYAKGTITVTPGETLNLLVAVQPTGKTAGYGGSSGGAGTTNNLGTPLRDCGAGGSSTEVNRGATRLMVGGGGGGGGAVSGTGGAGGGTTAANGAGNAAGGVGGSQTAAGAGGTPSGGLNGNAGSGATGGAGYTNGGGGGGGGYFGGGGGGRDVNGFSGGGGGGSGYASGTATTLTNGLQSGNGRILITVPNYGEGTPSVPTGLVPTGTLTTAKPLLQATVTSTGSGTSVNYLNAFFQVATDSGFTNVVFSGAGSTVAKGGKSVVYATGLAASTLYYYRAYATDGTLSSAYSASSTFTTSAPQTTSFAYTGAPQNFTVPPGVTSVTLDLSGAGGGNTNNAGGAGARVQGTLPTTPGETLVITVGGAGLSGSGGYNGGGTSTNTNNTQAYGGGFTDIRQGGNATGAIQALAAAGGGAGGSTNLYGGSAGVLGGNGGNAGGAFGGQGGTQTAGGATGGAAFQGANTTAYGGGGGGGGYYGGGHDTGQTGNGGGGGSSWASASVTNTSSTAGYVAGGNNGAASLSYPNYTPADTGAIPTIPTSITPTGTLTNAKPLLSTTVSSSSGGTLNAFYQVSTTVDFSNLVFSGAGSSVTSGGTSTVYATGLLGGTQYWVRAYTTDGTLSSAYSAASTFTTSASLVSSFAYTGSAQSWVVPTYCSFALVQVSGGDSAASITTGLGGTVTDSALPLTPGETLTLVVGGKGVNNSTAAVYGGGGGGNAATTTSSGGGYSGVFRGAATQANAVLIAGGQGGGSAGNGGRAGNPAGADGTNGDTNNANGGGGKGGTQAAGGAGGAGYTGAGTAGSALQGGIGYNTATPYGGGGGGGGYYGGGGGGGNSTGTVGTGYFFGDGGGGSSFAIASESSRVTYGVTGSPSGSPAAGAISFTYPNYSTTPPVAPLAPTLGAPIVNQVIGYASQTFYWTFNQGQAGDTQGGYIFQRTNTTTSAVDYWNNATQAFQSGAVTNNLTASNVIFPAGAWSPGSYTWTVATTQQTGTQGVFATARALTANSNGNVAQTFSYTGGAQTWVVPPTVTAVQVSLSGAQGGGPQVAGEAAGGLTTGVLAVTPGETLTIYVGGQGVAQSANGGQGGFNGGGAGGGVGTSPTYGPGAGGGGASDIRQGGTALTNRKAVAGGGGGHGSNSGTGQPAGNGGGLVGADAGGPNNGLGGTQSAGGASGGASGTGGAGSLGTGCGGGGGGGGYYGGGGGVGGTIGGSGGGGSGYVAGLAGGTTAQGGTTGNGSVTITYVSTSAGFSMMI